MNELCERRALPAQLASRSLVRSVVGWLSEAARATEAEAAAERVAAEQGTQVPAGGARSVAAVAVGKDRAEHEHLREEGPWEVSARAVAGRGRPWQAVEGRGRPWKAVEGRGRLEAEPEHTITTIARTASVAIAGMKE